MSKDFSEVNIRIMRIALGNNKTFEALNRIIRVYLDLEDPTLILHTILQGIFVG